MSKNIALQQYIVSEAAGFQHKQPVKVHHCARAVVRHRQNTFERNIKRLVLQNVIIAIEVQKCAQNIQFKPEEHLTKIHCSCTP